MSVKNVYPATIVAALLLSTTAAASPALIINDGQSIDVLTPPGFTYVASAGGASSVLDVTTEGYAICANVGQSVATPVSMQAHHPRWTMPIANDVRNVSYTGGVLRVNKGIGAFSPEGSLGCQVRGAKGELSSPFSGFGDGLFRDSWEGFASVQFGNLVNWLAVDGFSWSTPDWRVVPNDSCTWDMDPNAPQTAENSLCAAAAGVRPVAGGSQNDARYGDRAPTMWTATTTSNFIYLARIDARFGAQSGAPNSHFPIGTPQRPDQGQSSSVDVAIRDAYDSNYLSANGTYCLLRQLPAVLDDNVCSGGDVYYAQGLVDQDNPGGFVNERIPLVAGFNTAASLYVAVVRQKLAGGTSAASCQPYAAIAAISDPGVARNENGDEFIGDDVVFGFRNADSFEWMGCIP
ncbi:hypothetical protein FHW12_004114 [Dokdonella fugitiva]|uniref:Uncharacterized protein n=1 Tax=Dokdonella fugitiva TaxID=328517 RepID=A0A839EYS8_9GAMM|nr:hypothetical protein [Dokdonella fugitiva]MBA8889867.1 hypothetical protein [Dokdonella fugitiva]